MPRCLLLDLDGTLVDSVPDLAAALNRLMVARRLAVFDAPTVQSMVGDGIRALVERAFAARSIVPDDAAVAEFSATYGDHCADATRPYPGVADTLARLTTEGWRIGVCTNKSVALAEVVLRETGLSPFIATVGGGDSFPVRKPDPGHVLATLAAAGGRVGATVMAGDHRNDVLAARGAGIACVFAAWGYGTPAMAEGAAAVASSFGELARIAPALLAGAA